MSACKYLKFIKTKFQHIVYSYTWEKRELIIYLLSPNLTLKERVSNTKVFAASRGKSLELLNFKTIFLQTGFQDINFAWFAIHLNAFEPLEKSSCTLEHQDFSGGIHSISTGMESGICALLASLEASDPRGCESEFSAEQQKKTFTWKLCFHGCFLREVQNAEFGAGMEAQTSCGLKSPPHKLIRVSQLGFSTSTAHKNPSRVHCWSLSPQMGEVRWAFTRWGLSQRPKVS